MLVNVIGDHENVVLLAEVGDLLDLGPGENFAERIVRVVEDDRLRLRVEERLEFGRIQFPVGRTHHFPFMRWLQEKLTTDKPVFLMKNDTFKHGK